VNISGNLLANLPSALQEEMYETLVESRGVRIERIVSHGQTTPEGEWYDQEHAEWVMLVTGAASLQFEGVPVACRLEAGDYLMIPAHSRHRVAWTDPAVDTVWLAIHFNR
jgi:cupin 2 domain-containing protein